MYRAKFHGAGGICWFYRLNLGLPQVRVIKVITGASVLLAPSDFLRDGAVAHSFAVADHFIDLLTTPLETMPCM
jgi:hypothetical protein